MISFWMFLRVGVVLSLGSEADRQITTEKYQILRELIFREMDARTMFCTHVLAVVVVLKGSARMLFIGGGIAIAGSVVLAACPSLAQKIAEMIRELIQART
ncbi:MAG: hypothetical protein KIT67_15620 [Alphaproteobacteria bacterium]|nr:hypothetical protein [Alphaproteobacteria bacterium]